MPTSGNKKTRKLRGGSVNDMANRRYNQTVQNMERLQPQPQPHLPFPVQPPPPPTPLPPTPPPFVSGKEYSNSQPPPPPPPLQSSSGEPSQFVSIYPSPLQKSDQNNTKRNLTQRVSNGASKAFGRFKNSAGSAINKASKKGRTFKNNIQTMATKVSDGATKVSDRSSRAVSSIKQTFAKPDQLITYVENGTNQIGKIEKIDENEYTIKNENGELIYLTKDKTEPYIFDNLLLLVNKMIETVLDKNKHANISELSSHLEPILDKK